MQVSRLLQDLLFPVMHKKRATTLIGLICALLVCKKLSLTGLGRAYSPEILQRSGIRIADRFLGNKKVNGEIEAIHEVFTKHAIGARQRIDIIVDWTSIPNSNFHALRAAMVARGRSITLMQDVYPERKLGSKEVHNRFLDRLKKKIPTTCEVCIITDAGFHNDWFRKVESMGWDYIGRIRLGSGKKYFDEHEKTWKTLDMVSSQATMIPKFVGRILFCKTNQMQIYLYSYKSKKKGRKAKNKFGKEKKDSHTLEYRKSANEPWLLASSISPDTLTANKIVKKYYRRMQIEEGFRDLKSSKYGFSFEDASSKQIARIKILLLIAMLASYYAFIIGYIAEKNRLHYQFQSSSAKNRRSLSLFFLGCEIIKKKMKIPIAWIREAMTEQFCEL